MQPSCFDVCGHAFAYVPQMHRYQVFHFLINMLWRAKLENRAIGVFDIVLEPLPFSAWQISDNRVPQRISGLISALMIGQYNVELLDVGSAKLAVSRHEFVESIDGRLMVLDLCNHVLRFVIRVTVCKERRIESFFDQCLGRAFGRLRRPKKSLYTPFSCSSSF